jgi:large subunit ribosomal protein L25
METLKLAARVREERGKGAARKLRESGRIPAIFYGPKTSPVSLAVDYPELELVLKKAGSDNVILDLVMDSEKGSETKKAMLKELQVDALSQDILHADFYEISMDQEITVNVAVNLINTPVGVTNGGIQQQVRREITVSCLPDKLVEKIDLDVSGLDVGDSYHISDIVLPEGVRSELEGHLTVVTVAAPSVEPEVEEEELEEELEEAAEKAEAESEAEAEAETAE